MYPILFKIGSFELQTYGLMMTLGFATALILLRYLGRREGFAALQLTDLAFWSLIIGLVSARIMFVFTQWQYYSDHPEEILQIWQGGFVFYGGLAGGVVAVAIYCRKQGWPLFQILDVMVAPLALGHFLGRIGCFFAGCCFGKECATDFPLAVTFNHTLSAAPLLLPLHPTQLYDAANALCLALLALWLLPRRKFYGQITSIYLICYALLRYIVEEFRGDSVRGFVFAHFSTSQAISVFTLVAGIFIWRYASKSFPLKKEFIMKTLASLFLIFSVSTPSQAALNKSEIINHVSKAEKEAAQCNLYFERFRKLDKNYDNSTVFPTKALAIKALKELRAYKGTPTSTQALMDDLTVARGLDYTWLSQNINKTLVCDPNEYNQLLGKLVRSARKYTFNQKQKNFLGKVVLLQFKKELRSPTHPGLIAPYILILDGLVDLGAIRLSKTAALQRESVRQLLQKNMAVLKKRQDDPAAQKATAAATTKLFLDDVKRNEPVRVAFVRFVDSI